MPDKEVGITIYIKYSNIQKILTKVDLIDRQLLTHLCTTFDNITPHLITT